MVFWNLCASAQEEAEAAFGEKETSKVGTAVQTFQASKSLEACEPTDPTIIEGKRTTYPAKDYISLQRRLFTWNKKSMLATIKRYPRLPAEFFEIFRRYPLDEDSPPAEDGRKHIHSVKYLTDKASDPIYLERLNYMWKNVPKFYAPLYPGECNEMYECDEFVPWPFPYQRFLEFQRANRCPKRTTSSTAGLPKRNFQVAEYTGSHVLKGHRKQVAEDFVLSHTFTEKEAPGGRLLGILGVFDGHGGPLCARYCAENLVRRALDYRLPYQGDLAVSLTNLFYRLDADLYDENFIKTTKRCGTTATVVTIGRSGYCNLAFVGDSEAIVIQRYTNSRGVRCYSYTDFTRRERLHNAHNPLEYMRVGWTGYTMDPNGTHRVDGMIEMSRSLGDFRFKIPWVGSLFVDEKNHVVRGYRPHGLTSKPYVNQYYILGDEVCILIGSDGFFKKWVPHEYDDYDGIADMVGYLYDEIMETEQKARKAKLDALAANMCQRVKHMFSEVDDISCVLYGIPHEGWVPQSSKELSAQQKKEEETSQIALVNRWEKFYAELETRQREIDDLGWEPYLEKVRQDFIKANGLLDPQKVVEAVAKKRLAQEEAAKKAAKRTGEKEDIGAEESDDDEDQAEYTGSADDTEQDSESDSDSEDDAVYVDPDSLTLADVVGSWDAEAKQRILIEMKCKAQEDLDKRRERKNERRRRREADSKGK